MNDQDSAKNERARVAACRAGEWSAPREFTALVDLYCDALATPQDARQLSGWLTRDTDARRFFIAYLDLHARMQWEMRGVSLTTLAGEAFEGSCGAGVPPAGKLFGSSMQAGRPHHKGLLPAPLAPADELPPLAPASRGTLLWRQSLEFLSSTTLFCLLASMVFTSLGLMALALWTVPRGPAREGSGLIAAGPPMPLHIAGTAGSRWLGQAPAAIEIGSRLELDAGLAEIAFPSGARVLLEGPARFEVTGDNAARLERGRLSARVPPLAVGFAIDTPGARVVDLGTEFGIEVSSVGGSLVRVFAGTVEVQLRSEGSQRVRLAGGESAGWGAAGEEYRAAEVSARHFVRRLPLRLSPRVDLVEALLSRDGQALPRPAGLDPDSGAYVHELPARIARPGAGRFRARDSAFVDGLFLLPAQAGSAIIDSAGRAADFPPTAGIAHGIPWASRQWPIPASLLAHPVPYHERNSEAGWLSLPAGVGLTFDLDALRRASGADFERLRARGYRNPGDSRLDLWVLVDGAPCWKFDAVMSPVEDEPSADGDARSPSRSFEVLVPLEPSCHTLTLVAFEPAGVEEPSGVVLVDPHLEVREPSW